MGSFYTVKPLYTKVWRKRTTGISGTDSVRACINNGKDNFSIDVSFYKREDHLAAKKPELLPTAFIEIELPKGKVWSGTIIELQSLLLATAK